MQWMFPRSTESVLAIFLLWFESYLGYRRLLFFSVLLLEGFEHSYCCCLPVMLSCTFVLLFQSLHLCLLAAAGLPFSLSFLPYNQYVRVPLYITIRNTCLLPLASPVFPRSVCFPLCGVVFDRGGMSSMFGSSTAQLSHDHGTQFVFVAQSLGLWSEAMRNMYR